MVERAGLEPTPPRLQLGTLPVELSLRRLSVFDDASAYRSNSRIERF